jgi:hypothetical protein
MDKRELLIFDDPEERSRGGDNLTYYDPDSNDQDVFKRLVDRMNENHGLNWKFLEGVTLSASPERNVDVILDCNTFPEDEFREEVCA